jgi:hypothetical protein
MEIDSCFNQRGKDKTEIKHTHSISVILVANATVFGTVPLITGSLKNMTPCFPFHPPSSYEVQSK